MSDLIREFPDESFGQWRSWHTRRAPRSIDNATERVYDMLLAFKYAISRIERRMVKRWVKNAVLNKTFAGLRFQESILKRLAANWQQEETFATEFRHQRRNLEVLPDS